MRRLGVLLGTVVVLSASSASLPAAASAAACHTDAQNITLLKGISCQAARRVATAARNSLGPLPECTGEAPKIWHGWSLVGSTKGGIGIATTFTKGSRSFLLAGGGTCGSEG